VLRVIASAWCMGNSIARKFVACSTIVGRLRVQGYGHLVKPCGHIWWWTFVFHFIRCNFIY
jgi:hypothetical protein